MFVTDFMHLSLIVFLGALAFSIAVQLLTGMINTRGLLRDKVDGRISPGRAQLLLLSITGAGLYLLNVLSQECVGELPPLPKELLLLVGGSNAFYLGGKFRSVYRNWFKLR